MTKGKKKVNIHSFLPVKPQNIFPHKQEDYPI
jgi:hypothetical protein